MRPFYVVGNIKNEKLHFQHMEIQCLSKKVMYIYFFLSVTSSIENSIFIHQESEMELLLLIHPDKLEGNLLRYGGISLFFTIIKMSFP